MTLLQKAFEFIDLELLIEVVYNLHLHPQGRAHCLVCVSPTHNFVELTL